MNPLVRLIRIPYSEDDVIAIRHRTRAHGTVPRLCAPESTANARQEESLDAQTSPYESRAEGFGEVGKTKINCLEP